MPRHLGSIVNSLPSTPSPTNPPAIPILQVGHAGHSRHWATAGIGDTGPRGEGGLVNGLLGCLQPPSAGPGLLSSSLKVLEEFWRRGIEFQERPGSCPGLWVSTVSFYSACPFSVCAFSGRSDLRFPDHPALASYLHDPAWAFRNGKTPALRPPLPSAAVLLTEPLCLPL